MMLRTPLTPDLRLQLLEPEKYPYLSKCLYGLLMILPQSSAFVSLRARLSVVNSSGYVPPPNKPNYSANVGSGRTKVGEIKWQELLAREWWRAVGIVDLRWRAAQIVEVLTDYRLPGRPSPA